jgi:hypothetical protein
MITTEISRKYTIRLLVYTAVLLLISGCSPAFLSKSPGIISVCQISAPKDFNKEILRLKEETREDNEVSVRAVAHLILSALHSHYENPSPDYLKALKELRAYISLDPDGAGRDDIQNRLVLLLRFQALSKKNQKLKKSLTQLDARNKEMKETIERLKNLDISLEKKRRQVK